MCSKMLNAMRKTRSVIVYNNRKEMQLCRFNQVIFYKKKIFQLIEITHL